MPRNFLALSKVLGLYTEMPTDNTGLVIMDFWITQTPFLSRQVSKVDTDEVAWTGVFESP